MATAPDTLEFHGVHAVLETNPWLLGDQFETWVSNKTLSRIAREVADGSVSNAHGRERPDLLLIGLSDRVMLVELKRPSHTVTWDDVAQAKKYRDILRRRLANKTFSVCVLGGTADPEMAREQGALERVSTYGELVAEARSRLQWLIANVDDDVQGVGQSAQRRMDI